MLELVHYRGVYILKTLLGLIPVVLRPRLNKCFHASFGLFQNSQTGTVVPWEIYTLGCQGRTRSYSLPQRCLEIVRSSTPFFLKYAIRAEHLRYCGNIQARYRT